MLSSFSSGVTLRSCLHRLILLFPPVLFLGKSLKATSGLSHQRQMDSLYFLSHPPETSAGEAARYLNVMICWLNFSCAACAQGLLPLGPIPYLHTPPLYGWSSLFQTFLGFLSAVIELVLIIFLLLLYTAKSSSSDTEPEAKFLRWITFTIVVINQ